MERGEIKQKLCNVAEIEGTHKDINPLETQKPEVTYRFILITRIGAGAEAVVHNCEHAAVNRSALFNYIFKHYSIEQIETVSILSESKE